MIYVIPGTAGVMEVFYNEQLACWNRVIYDWHCPEGAVFREDPYYNKLDLCNWIANNFWGYWYED